MAEAPAREEKFVLSSSRGFAAWLGRSGGCVTFTTYQAGKLFLLGVRPDGRLWIFERTFPRAMGLAAWPGGRSFALATQIQIHRFDNVLPAGSRQGDVDAVFAPHASWITGDLDVHDVAIGAGGRPVFVNTLFSCLASVSEGASFRPLWKPGFVTRLAPEDRCHLNGLAMEGDKPRWVTAVGASDVADGWRDRRATGGIVIDVEADRIAAEGLSMPHSPRLHEGKLWLLNSGTGELGWVDTSRGRFEAVAFCPGYARGLAFAGPFALVGLSLARENRTFSGLPLDEALRTRGAEPRCGLLVIDTRNGDTVEWVRIEGVVRELYDVCFLPGVRQPSAIGFVSDEIRRVISIEE